MNKNLFKNTLKNLPSENRDHTYLLTKNNVLFCVAGNYHSFKYINGMPYYFLKGELESILNTKINSYITVGDKKFSKLLNYIDLSEYPSFIKKNYKSYYYSPCGWRSLMKVNRSEIKKVFDPQKFVKHLLKKSELKKHKGNPIIYLLKQMHSYNPLLLSNVGITGSALITKNINHFGKDIDLVFYGNYVALLVEEFSFTVCKEDPRINSLMGNHLKEYVKNKINKFPGTEKEFIRLVKDRWDTIFVDGFKVDFTFCKDNTETEFLNNMNILRPVSIRTKITDVSESYFLPTVLGIENPRFEKVIITARGYICLFKQNDKVEIRGTIHYSKKTQKELIVVDELAGGRVVILD